MKKRVVELFAGVGGFRVGLNNIVSIDKKGKAIEKGQFDFVWANQWEPSTKSQHAFDCYKLRFSENNVSNLDISKVNKKEIPDHELLCGGFPCQDYSVAHTLKSAKGIEGKKGVLWWQINEILSIKKPPFVLLENVDRLIKSPAYQRGRDFGIMLRCLSDLGYALEWRVINAAEYGHPQRRRRIFLFAFKNNTKYYANLKNKLPSQIIQKDGIFAKAFPIKNINNSNIKEIDFKSKYNNLIKVSEKFQAKFENAGIMIDGKAYTIKSCPILNQPTILKNIIESKVDKHFYLSKEQIAKFKYLRGKKRQLRTGKNGFKYYYSEGAMSPYDELTKPSRTMLTSEGTINRSTHIVKTNNKLRLLTPIECERLNQFPDNWTNSGMTEKRRYFMMGNALVCGIILKLGKQISIIIDNE